MIRVPTCIRPAQSLLPTLLTEGASLTLIARAHLVPYHTRAGHHDQARRGHWERPPARFRAHAHAGALYCLSRRETSREPWPWLSRTRALSCTPPLERTRSPAAYAAQRSVHFLTLLFIGGRTRLTPGGPRAQSAAHAAHARQPTRSERDTSGAFLLLLGIGSLGVARLVLGGTILAEAAARPLRGEP